MDEDLAIAFGAGDLGRRFGLDRVPNCRAGFAEAREGCLDRLGVAHDTALPHIRPPDLELRLEEGDHLGVWRRVPNRRQHLLQADEGDVDHDQADGLGKRFEVTSVDPLDDHDPRVLSKAPVEQAATHVERVNLRRAAAEQNVCEAACRRAHVGADPSVGVDTECVQGRPELERSAARKPRFGVDGDRRVLAHRSRGAAHGLACDANLPRQDQGLRSLARLRQAVLRHQYVKPRHQLAGRKIPTASPITAPTSTSNGVCPRSSRSRASCTPRMWTRSSTSRFRTSAWRPAARRRPAASYITTNVKIRAIANGAEVRPAYLPMAAVRPITIALWLLGMPPVSARTRRFSLRSRNHVNVTLAIWAMTHATSGASRYFNSPAILRFRPHAISTGRTATAPRPAGGPPVDARPPARPGAPSPPQAGPSSLRARRGDRRAPEADSSRRCCHPAEDPVDEPARLIAGKRLGQLDRFVDRGLGRHLAIDGDLIDGDAQDDAIHLGHLVQLPVLRRLAHDRVEPLAILDNPVHELTRKIRDVLARAMLGRVVAQHLFRVILSAFELE